MVCKPENSRTTPDIFSKLFKGLETFLNGSA